MKLLMSLVTNLKHPIIGFGSSEDEVKFKTFLSFETKPKISISSFKVLKLKDQKLIANEVENHKEIKSCP